MTFGRYQGCWEQLQLTVVAGCGNKLIIIENTELDTEFLGEQAADCNMAWVNIMVLLCKDNVAGIHHPAS